MYINRLDRQENLPNYGSNYVQSYPQSLFTLTHIVICLERSVFHSHFSVLRCVSVGLKLPIYGNCVRVCWGGGGTASLKVGTHCQTYRPCFFSNSTLYLTVPYIYLGVPDHCHLKSDILIGKLSTIVISSILQGFPCYDLPMYYTI